MKKIKAILTRTIQFITGFMLLPAWLFAQVPDFTSSYYPHPDSIEYAQFASATGLSLGTPGESQIWNYTGLVDSGSLVAEVFDSALLTQWGGLFGNANIAQGSSGSGYLYSEANSNSFSILGFAGPMQGDTFYFTTPQVIYPYPFTYLTQSNSAFSGYSSSSANGVITVATRTGTDTFNADGYGTLELPGQDTFINVLRAVINENYKDVITKSGVRFDSIFYRTNTVDYLLPAISTQPILSISRTSRNEAGHSTSYCTAYFYPYSPPFPSGVQQINSFISGLKVFPNPSYSQSVLSLNLQKPSLVNVYLINVLGQKIKTITTEQTEAGNNIYRFETNDLAKGIYLVTVEVNGYFAGVTKLVVE